MPWQAFFKSRRNERRHEVDSPDVPLRAEGRLTKRFALPPYFEQQQFIEAGIFRAWMRAETRHKNATSRPLRRAVAERISSWVSEGIDPTGKQSPSLFGVRHVSVRGSNG